MAVTVPGPLQEKTFTVDARTVLQLGRQSIKDHTTAILELVKNSYDADATIVEVEIIQSGPTPYIRVADNGTGMTEDDIDQKWLRIGYSDKPNNPVTATRRRKTGEKGVGRISADRLGAELRLASRAHAGEAVGLQIDWDRFDVSGRELAQISVGFARGVALSIPTPDGRPDLPKTGTELVISKLRQTWTRADLRTLHEELSYLTPPFSRVVDFSVRLSSDVAPELNGEVGSPFFELAEIDLSAELIEGRVSYAIKNRIGHREPLLAEEGHLDWPQLMRLVSREMTGEVPESMTGPVSVRLLLYPRKAETLVGSSFRLSDLRDFLNQNAGVKIYRDQVRVRPYGDADTPEGDWLGLAERKTREPAGISRRQYRVGANQLVGAVFVSRDQNPALVDSAAREGLIHNDAFVDLRILVLGCLTLLEAHRYEAVAKTAKREPLIDPLATVGEAKTELDVLRADLQVVRKAAPAGLVRSVERALDAVEVIGSRIRLTEEAVRDALNETGVLRGLATLGIAASVFGHETQSSISSLLASTRLARELATDREIDTEVLLEELEKAVRAAKQVSAWGAFALARVRRDKRERRNVKLHRTVVGIVEGLREPFGAASISLRAITHEVTARTFEMDIEAVLLNLLTNAYVACLQVRDNRKVRVDLAPEKREDRDGFMLSVADSGPGVPQPLEERIWAPLFTTRTDEKGRQTGTGLGLSIVRSIVDEMRGEVSVSRDAELGGALFTAWMPLR